MRVVNALSAPGPATAKVALIITAVDDPTGKGFREGEAAVTIHPIANGEIGAGSLLDQAGFADLMRLVAGEGLAEQARQVLPPNVLYAGGDRMLWHCPSRRDLIWFRTGRRDFDDAVNGKAVRWPPLLFLAKPASLYVWALESDTRPDETTPVLLAPFFNVYETGSLCEGNVPLPAIMQVDDIPKWEAAFFDTQFTHSNYGLIRFTAHPGGHDGLWRERVAAKDHKHFQAAHLTPARSPMGRPLTVKGALNA